VEYDIAEFSDVILATSLKDAPNMRHIVSMLNMINNRIDHVYSIHLVATLRDDKERYLQMLNKQ
jgi:hypothetical protein